MRWQMARPMPRFYENVSSMGLLFGWMARRTAPVTMMTLGVAMMMEYVFSTVQSFDLWLMF